MAHQADDDTEVQRLLRPLSTKWVEAVCGVTRETVATWRSGDSRPRPDRWDKLVAAVANVLPPGTTKEAAPHIGERLDELLVLVRAIADATPGLDLVALDDIHRRVLELERARQRPDVPRQSEDQATRDAETSSGR